MALFIHAISIVAMAVWLGSTVSAQTNAVNTACSEAPYILHMSGTADAKVNSGSTMLINGSPLRVYEGEPLEWTHYAVTQVACDDVALAEEENADAAVVAGVFHGGPPDHSEADLVPEHCDDPIYLLGVNTVTDTDQYGIYATALGDSKITQRHGFVRLFGRTPNPLLAGVWPDNTTGTLSIWPCLEAFDIMYNSDWYQKDILPLRKDAAHYRLMVFRPADQN